MLRTSAPLIGALDVARQADIHCLAEIHQWLPIYSTDIEHRGPEAKKMSNKKPSPFLESVRVMCLRRGYSERTANSYRYWAKRYILFHRKQHPSNLGKQEIESFLNSMVVANYSSASQSAALHAVLFMYRFVLDSPVSDLKFTRVVKRHQQMPIVLSSNGL